MQMLSPVQLLSQGDASIHLASDNTNSRKHKGLEVQKEPGLLNPD